jgi:hypothetical protein
MQGREEVRQVRKNTWKAEREAGKGRGEADPKRHVEG